MLNDSDLDCVEHVWQLRGVALGPDGSTENYECVRCAAVTVVTAAPTPEV